MAATVALTRKKQIPFSVRAGKKITKWSKALSIILAASAEPLMRYTTIYLALATALPVIKVAALYSACQGVVIAAPEFVIIGAFNIADEELKREDGQRTWGWILRVICLLMSLIMIATFVDIFIVSFDELALKLLNFARCLIAVGFTVTLGKLDRDEEEDEGAAASTQPVPTSSPAPAPSQEALDQALAKLKDDLLQQIRVEVRAHVHVVEEADRTPQQSNLLSSGDRTATAPAIGQESEQAPESEEDHESTDDRTATTKADRTGVDKLELTLDFIRENPGRTSSPDFDALLADHLGLKRPASARFWRLKAQELLNAEAASKSNDQGAYARVLAYVQTHEPVTQKEVAAHLGITERTVRRHFAALRTSGQLPLAWTRNEEDTKEQPIGQQAPESDRMEERTADNETQDSETSLDNVVLFRHAAR